MHSGVMLLVLLLCKGALGRPVGTPALKRQVQNVDALLRSQGDNSHDGGLCRGLSVRGGSLLAGTNHDSEVSRGMRVRGGSMLAGMNPFGYKISSAGEKFLEYEGSRDSDLGRLLSSVISKRKTLSTLKSEWLELMRYAKTGQSVRIYKARAVALVRLAGRAFRRCRTRGALARLELKQRASFAGCVCAVGPSACRAGP